VSELLRFPDPTDAKQIKGANMYQVLYLWWFYVDGTRTTTGMRDYAQQEGQRIIDRGFVTNPGYVI